MYVNVGALRQSSRAIYAVTELDPKLIRGIRPRPAEIQSANPQAGLDDLTHAQTLANELGNEEEQGHILQAMGVAYS